MNRLTLQINGIIEYNVELYLLGKTLASEWQNVVIISSY